MVGADVRVLNAMIILISDNESRGVVECRESVGRMGDGDYRVTSVAVWVERCFSLVSELKGQLGLGNRLGLISILGSITIPKHYYTFYQRSLSVTPAEMYTFVLC